MKLVDVLTFIDVCSSSISLPKIAGDEVIDNKKHRKLPYTSFGVEMTPLLSLIIKSDFNQNY